METDQVTNIVMIILEVVSILLAIASLVIAILSFVVVKKINKQQVLREQYQYLMDKVVFPYNLIEADIMLLAEGIYDVYFSKEQLDKQTLLSLSQAKSFAKFIRNESLFDYIDCLISGNKLKTGGYAEEMGKLIEDYFKSRPTKALVESELITIGKSIRDRFLKKTRRLRDNTISRIKKIIH